MKRSREQRAFPGRSDTPGPARRPLPNVAIGGRMRVGKTTCAEHLEARHGYRRRALADPIKEIAREGFGWDGSKDARGRRLLQELGTAGRAHDPEIWLKRFDAWLAAHLGGPLVVDDVRLLAEVEHFRRLGFLTVLVLRPDATAVARAEEGAEGARAEGSAPAAGARAPAGDKLRAHETETEIEGARLDVVLVNDGTVTDLRRKLDAILAEQRARR